MAEGTIAHPDAEIAAAFWKSKQGTYAAAGARLDNSAILPYFLCAGLKPLFEFTSDEAVAEFYATGGRYDAIKLAVIEAWPR